MLPLRWWVCEIEGVAFNYSMLDAQAGKEIVECESRSRLADP